MIHAQIFMYGIYFCQIRTDQDSADKLFSGIEKARKALKIKDSRAFKPFLFRSIILRLGLLRMQENLDSTSFHLGRFLHSNEYSQTKRLLNASIRSLLSVCIRSNPYLFENCGARRAALRPYFFLSFIRGSLVR